MPREHRNDSAVGLSFVVPVFNEEAGIGKLVDDLAKTLAPLHVPTEIIIVNDGSTDATRRILESGIFSNLQLIDHPVNAGYGAALKSGIIRARYPWIGIIDGDGSYDCSAIPTLFSFVEKGFDMVIAERGNISELDSLPKRIMRSLLRRMISILVDKDIRDPNSGLRIFRKSTVDEFLPYLCNTFSFTTSLTIFFAERGSFLKYVPTTYLKRKGISKVRHFRDSIRTLQMVFQGLAYFNPLKAFVFLVIALVGTVCIPAMVLALFEFHTLALYSMIFGSTSFSLIGLGLVADAIRISRTRTPEEQQSPP